MKFSLKTLLAVTACAAILAAGLVVASEFWSRTVFLMTFVAIALAMTAAFSSVPTRRPVWGAFALVAGGYLYVAVLWGREDLFPTSQLLDLFQPPANLAIAPAIYPVTMPPPQAYAPALPPSDNSPAGVAGALTIPDSAATNGQPAQPYASAPVMTGTVPMTSTITISPTPIADPFTTFQHRKLAGHCAFALLFGLIGALSAWFAVGRQAEPEPRNEPSAPLGL